MQLARPFSDYMVLQRGKPIFIMGTAEREQSFSIWLNGALLLRTHVLPGEFSFCLPAQEAMEDATLEIGDVALHHVDIGEVWVAGGQSNMEFLLKYAAGGEEEAASADDAHLRMYTVGQYAFAGERALGYKAWEPWDRWLPCTPAHAGDFSAVGLYFAKELRRALGVPVGVINCSWGGTSASAWTDRTLLQQYEPLRIYLEEFDAAVRALDLARYERIKSLVRPMLASPENRAKAGWLSKNTLHPRDLEKAMAAQSAPADAPKDNPLAGISPAEMMAFGPGESNEPGALFENMVLEIAGISVRGVIWYQGESDDKKAVRYGALFAALTQCWRQAWRRRNPAQEALPFLAVQLAPFGVWLTEKGEEFPILRQSQEHSTKLLDDVWMTSISDIGNVFDIHPKVKKPVGERLALLARRAVYGEKDLLALPPRPRLWQWTGDTLRIAFENGEGLRIEPGDFSAYNGFAVADIPEALLPPILGGVNGLSVTADGLPLTAARCETHGACLWITAPELTRAHQITVAFAQTAFYQVNLYNAAHLPAIPFVHTLNA